MEAPFGVMTLLVSPQGIHGFFQILIVLPLPTLQIKPSFKVADPSEYFAMYRTFLPSA
jgi:hypothetical protein